MSQPLYRPIGRHALEYVPYPMYYPPVEWIAAPNPPSYPISSPNPCTITDVPPAFTTDHYPIPADFGYVSYQRTEHDVFQQVPRPVYNRTSSLTVSHVAEASSSNPTLKSPYRPYGHPERPEHGRTKLSHRLAIQSSSLGITTSVDGHQYRKSTSPPSNSSVPKSSRRQLTHLESEKKRREAINAGLEALRRAIPGCDGDSKAIILEKTVQYILQLESLLPDANLRETTDRSCKQVEEESLIKSEPE